MKSLLLSLSTLMICFGCNNSSETTGEIPSDENPSLVIVLCDVSGTISRIGQKHPSTNSLDNIIRHCTDLLVDKKKQHHFNDKSRIIFLPIRENMYAEPIGDIVLNQVSLAGEEDEQKMRAEAAQHIADSLQVLAKSHYDNTCILTSIGRAYNLFVEKSASEKDQYSYKLIILSDMLEDCPSSTVGNVDLQNKFEESLRLIDAFKSEINLDSQNIKLSVVVTSHNITGKQNERLKTFWTKAFGKMGYSRSINFTGEI